MPQHPLAVLDFSGSQRLDAAVLPEGIAGIEAEQARLSGFEAIRFHGA